MRIGSGVHARLVGALFVATVLIAVDAAPAAAASWSIVATPNPPNASTIFRGVSCGAPGNCIAVGSSGPTGSPFSDAIAARWNGTSWSMTAAPLAGTNSELDAVTCLSATNCFATGVFSTAANDGKAQTLVERWNGATWTKMATPTPSSLYFGPSMVGVACASATTCFAVGYLTELSYEYTLLLRWNGHTWGYGGVADPSNFAELHGIACPGPTSCWAIGADDNGTLIEHWNGARWSIVPNTLPVDDLDAISCPTATSCYAVGTYGINATGRKKAPIAHWNGATWSFTDSPTISTSYPPHLDSVSCASDTDCFAVGTLTKGGQETLIEHWNGASWSVVASPSPADRNAYLWGVARVPGTARFVAVGNSKKNGASVTLAERYP